MTSVLSNFLSISLPFSERDAGKHTECEMVWDAVSSRAFGPQGLLDLYFNLPLSTSSSPELQSDFILIRRVALIGQDSHFGCKATLIWRLTSSNIRGTIHWFTTCNQWNEIRFSCQGNLLAATAASILQLPLSSTIPNIHTLDLGWPPLPVYPGLSAFWHWMLCILGKRSVPNKQGQLVSLCVTRQWSLLIFFLLDSRHAGIPFTPPHPHLWWGVLF